MFLRFIIRLLFSIYFEASLSNNELVCLFQKLRRNGPVQRPGDIHGPAALVLYVVGGAQEGVRLGAPCNPVCLELPDEQQHSAPPLPMVDIPLTGRRVRRRGALALPVEQALVDGVVVVHGGG